MTIAEWIAQSRARCEAATPGEITYGVRHDGSRWLSIGNPRTGPHIQADWEFDENNAAAFKSVRTDLPRALEALEVAMEFATHEDSLWGDPDNPAAKAMAKVTRILNGEAA